MHTQCREKTKDIDHTFQMVGGQNLVNVSAESLFRVWGTHGKMNTFSSHSPLTKSQWINKYIHTRNITTTWPWPMVWNATHRDGHNNVGRLDEREMRASKGASQESGDLSIYMGGPSGKVLMLQLWTEQPSWWRHRLLLCPLSEWEHDMTINMRIVMAAVDLVQIHKYNPQNYRLLLYKIS